jgi:hypothetical protein
MNANNSAWGLRAKMDQLKCSPEPRLPNEPKLNKTKQNSMPKYKRIPTELTEDQ